jgi:integrase
MAVFLRGTTYYLKFRHGGRQILRSLKTDDRDEASARAKRLLATLKTPVDTGSDTAPADTVAFRSASLGAIYEVFRDRVALHVQHGHVRPSYQSETASIWTAHLKRFSARIVDRQLNGAVVEYLDRQALSVARRRKVHTLLCKLAGDAGVTFKPHKFFSATPPKEVRPLEPCQVERVKSECLTYPHPVARLIYLAAVTGARIGEIMALARTDLGSDYISISKTKCSRTGKVVAAKTRNSRRVIPVSPAVLDVVRPSIGYPGKQWFSVWRAIRKRAAIGSVGIHALRHSWATHALAAGLTPKAVSLALGHATVSFTEAQYARFLTTGHFKSELAAFNQ